MGGHRQTGTLLVIALIPGVFAGCASSGGSRLAIRKQQPPVQTPDQRQALAQSQSGQQYPPQQPKALVSATPQPSVLATQPNVTAATPAPRKPAAKPVTQSMAERPLPPPVNLPQSAAPASSAATREFRLVAESDSAKESPFAATEESLADWSEAEEAEEDLELPSPPSSREFPTDEVVTSEESSLEAVPAVSGETQSVSTEDTPFTVVEDSNTAPAPPTDVVDELSNAFDEPESMVDGWAASKTGLPDRFTKEWVESRLAQIAERSGQTGFMGFCPVALYDELRLIDAQAEFTVEHQSQKYQFSSEAAMNKFIADPERYLPAAGGLDVVAVSQGTAVAQGSLEHALWFRHKLYLFTSHDNLETFRKQAKAFAVQQ